MLGQHLNYRAVSFGRVVTVANWPAGPLVPNGDPTAIMGKRI
jgi:hypothetical protein